MPSTPLMIGLVVFSALVITSEVRPQSPTLSSSSIEDFQSTVQKAYSKGDFATVVSVVDANPDMAELAGQLSLDDHTSLWSIAASACEYVGKFSMAIECRVKTQQRMKKEGVRPWQIEDQQRYIERSRVLASLEQPIRNELLDVMYNDTVSFLFSSGRAKEALLASPAQIALVAKYLPSSRELVLELQKYGAIARRLKRADAKDKLDRAVKVARESLGKNHPLLAQVLEDRARHLEDSGDDAAAISDYRESLSTREQALGESHRYTLWNLTSFIGIHFRLGDIATANNAVSKLQQRIQMNGDSVDPHYPGMEWLIANEPLTLLTIVNAHRANGRTADALGLITTLTNRHPDNPHLKHAYVGCLPNDAEKSKSILRELSENKSLAWKFRIFAKLSLVDKTDDFDEQIDLLQQVVSLYKEHERRNPNLLADTHESLAIVALDKPSHHQIAASSIRDCLATRYQQWKRIRRLLSARQKFDLVEPLKRAVDILFDLHSAKTNVVDTDEVFEWYLRVKGIVFDEQVFDRRLARLDSTTRTDYRRKLNRLELLLRSDAFDSNQVEELVVELDAVERQGMGPGNQVRAEPSVYLASIPADTIVLDMWDFFGNLGVFVCGNSRVIGYKCVMKDVALDKAANAIVNNNLRGDNSRRAFEHLTEQFWLPIRSWVPKDSKFIAVCADGPLNSIPFAAIPDKIGGEPLVKKFCFYHVFSPSHLGETLRPDFGNVLLVGNVDYGDRPLNALAGTHLECTKIKARLRDRGIGEISYLNQSQPTTSRFLSSADEHPSIIHLATHGRLLQITPNKSQPGDKTFNERITNLSPESFSEVILAPGVEGGGTLTGAQIMSLPLHDTSLVVLSACDSAKGFKGKGAESARGLQRGFHIAGAKVVIAARSSVSDSATVQLMDYFYRSMLEGDHTTPVTALRDAQLRMLKHYVPPSEDRIRIGYNDDDSASIALKPSEGDILEPFYWASFQASVIGE